MEKIIEILATELNIPKAQVANVCALLDDGATIPFISRYRKEATGGLDEVAIQSICTRREALLEIEKRKCTILTTIEEAGKLTPELRQKILGCYSATELEDIYLPYKPKRRTRAEIARGKGLEPLARIIMAQHGDDIERTARRFVGDKVTDSDEAINGALDIIAEWVSENEAVRGTVRGSFRRTAALTCKVVKGKEEEGEKYRNYFDCTEPLRRCSSHRLLAMRRGEKEGFLKVAIATDDDQAQASVQRIVVRGNGEASALVGKAATDSYKRLIRPSIETEFAASSKERADDEAIDMFAENLRQLLFAPPLGHKRVLAVDPGYRTGCKVVCLDEQGNLLHHDVIYPTPPRNDLTGASRKVANLVEVYKIDAIALGNGTASRETEKFLTSLRYGRDIKVYVVSESGASVYSASKIARDEFPDKDVTVRGAVSIGRRLIDPLAELVKIDPKSIGVGQYQHDVDQTKLKRALDFTVESCVNSVGVNVNTASRELLTYVAGLGPQLAKNIVEYRAANGDFHSRRDIMKVPRMGAKAYQQCAGFLRIPESDNPLDNSAVHPERYALVERMARDCGCTVAQLIASPEQRKKININRYVSAEVGLPTLTDIMQELEKPGRDPRKGIGTMAFDDNITDISQLHTGMELNGIVTNLTQFGAFVDIGVHENGLVHISEMSDHYIASPTEVVKVHQHVRVAVKDIDTERRRISLTMKGIKQ